MRQGSTVLEAEIPVKLSDDDREARHASLLFHLGEAERLEAKKKADAKATQELIDNEWAECYRLRRVLLDDQENRKQGDLRFGDDVVPSSAEATAALAEVARATGETDDHGAGGEGAQLPSEPHEFTLPPSMPNAIDFPCVKCGAHIEDPVHHGGEAHEIGEDGSCEECRERKAARLHTFELITDEDQEPYCFVCGDVESAAIHRKHPVEYGGREGDAFEDVCLACELSFSDPIHTEQPTPEAAEVGGEA